MTQYIASKFPSQASELTAITRPRLLFALMLLTIANGTIGLLFDAVQDQGWANAAVNGLGVSWAFWASWGLALWLAFRAEPTAATRSDIAVAAVCVVAVLVPNHHLSTVAATLAGAWFAFRPGSGARLRGAALILLALTVNLLWTRVVMLVAARPIEYLDAHLVGLVAQTPVHANVVHFLHNGGQYVILSGCTSVENASMALLLWIAIARNVRPEPRPSDLLIAGAILLTVVAINVARLSLMAQSLTMFEFWHGPTGGTIINVLITLAGLAWAAFDVRHELLA